MQRVPGKSEKPCKVLSYLFQIKDREKKTTTTTKDKKKGGKKSVLGVVKRTWYISKSSWHYGRTMKDKSRAAIKKKRKTPSITIKKHKQYLDEEADREDNWRGIMRQAFAVYGSHCTIETAIVLVVISQVLIVIQLHSRCLRATPRDGRTDSDGNNRPRKLSHEMAQQSHESGVIRGLNETKQK